MKERFWYTLFDVEWGHFGILAGDRGVYGTALPFGGCKTTQKDRLVGIVGAKYDRWLMKPLQERVRAYFAGVCVEFSDVGVCLDGVSDFGVGVLTSCRKVGYGEQASYGQLAKAAGSKGAARAVGGVMGQNALPLIIPCHRIVRSDGSIGGFMQGLAGGIELKRRMLALENAAIRD